jgi:hypothetical protein
MRDTLTTFVIVSFAYIISYALTTGFVSPLQSTFLADVSDKIGLLFLPHGVRIIAIYYYGWRAILLLLPASYLMWFLVVYRGEIDLSMYAPIVSLVACWIGVTLAKVVFEERSKMLDLSAWKLSDSCWCRRFASEWYRPQFFATREPSWIKHSWVHDWGFSRSLRQSFDPDVCLQIYEKCGTGLKEPSQ